MIRLQTHISFKFRPARLLKSNGIKYYSTSEQVEPPHEFLTVKRILPNAILVPLLRKLYSTDNLHDREAPLIIHLSNSFKNRHSQLTRFWCSSNPKDLVNPNSAYLKPVHIRNLESFILSNKLRSACSV